MFNPGMLILAREARKLSQVDLGEKVNVPQGHISRYEAGTLSPSEALLHKFADALQFPVAFFSASELSQAGGVTFYRKKSSVSVGEVRRQNAFVTIILQHLKKVIPGTTATFPVIAVSPSTTAEEVARQVRLIWKLGDGPIKNVTSCIEANGGVVVESKLFTEDTDALHQFATGLPPLFCTNVNRPGDRVRFSLSHEIGHAVMHRDPIGEFEEEANHFAAEFLMPARSIKHVLKNLDLPAATVLKKEWGVSIAALLFRAKELGAITPSRAKQLWCKLSALGWRKSEPVFIPCEVPERTNRLLMDFRKAQGGMDAAAASLCCSVEDLRKMYEVFESN